MKPYSNIPATVVVLYNVEFHKLIARVVLNQHARCKAPPPKAVCGM